jgi:hypothetical protein
MLDWSSCPEVDRDPERLGGAWVFPAPEFRSQLSLKTWKTGVK